MIIWTATVALSSGVEPRGRPFRTIIVKLVIDFDFVVHLCFAVGKTKTKKKKPINEKRLLFLLFTAFFPFD